MSRMSSEMVEQLSFVQQLDPQGATRLSVYCEPRCLQFSNSSAGLRWISCTKGQHTPQRSSQRLPVCGMPAWKRLITAAWIDCRVAGT